MAAAGELMHVDIKPLGRFRQPGTGCMASPARLPGAGWEHVHVAIEINAAGVRRGPAGAARPRVRRLSRAGRRWFAARGVTCQRVMSDNGSGYRSRAFRQVCARLALRHLRTRPYTPRTNGKAERFIQTLLREWAYARPTPPPRAPAGAPPLAAVLQPAARTPASATATHHPPAGAAG